MTIPDAGRSPVDVLTALEAMRADDPPVRGGRVFAYVYDSGVETANEAALDALASFGEVNALDPTTFPSVARIENELVGWGLNLMRAPECAVGLVTSGGTESCMLAVLAARERWAQTVGNGTPVVIVADTVHPAFHKAAHLLGLGVRTVPVDRSSMRLLAADVRVALQAVGRDAALVVASAPSYAHGVVDEVEDIATVAAEHDVPCHVDACIGGITLAYARINGDDVPGVDFTVPGVASISVDLHKYGFAPKGVSLLLFRDPAYRSGTFFAFSSWPGYPVVNTTLQSTKSAGPMAAAWATAQVLGNDGYREAVRRARAATEQIADIVDAIPGLRVVGSPDATLVAIAGDDPEPIDPFRLADAMRHRGWVLQPQPSCNGLPRTVHLTVQPVSLEAIGALADDLRAAAEEARAMPWADASTDLEAAFAAIPDLTSGEALPPEMADVHALIDALPPEVRDQALSAIFSAIFTARR